MIPRKQLLQGVSALLITSLLCALIVTTADHLTRDRIEGNRRQAALKIINEVMPLEHSNDLLNDTIELSAPVYPGAENPVNVYRARQGHKPVGLVFMPVIAKGYNGPIELAIGIAFDGTLLAVRVNGHKETEGLGDGIDQRRSGWIDGFENRSLQNTSSELWAVKSDSGDFDQLSGATISPRGVINAVKSTLEFYAINRGSLY